MANLVSHVVSVSGPADAVAAFRRLIFGADAQRPVLDFGAFIPKPEIVRGTGGSSEVTDGLIILGEDEVPEQFGKTAGEQVALMLDYPWVREAGVVDRAGLVELLTRRAREAGRLDATLDGARRALRAWRETGHASEQSWAIRHWGVRGNPESFEIVEDAPGRLGFAFATAWSTPEPVWSRMAQAFPELVITVVGFEEAWHFAVEGEIRDGENRVKEVEPTNALYRQVFGEEPEEEGVATDEAAPQPPADPPRPNRWEIVEEKGWRRYKWDLLGWLIGAVIVAIYFMRG